MRTVQIGAAREMAAAKGGEVSDISLLKSGQFTPQSRAAASPRSARRDA